MEDVPMSNETGKDNGRGASAGRRDFLKAMTGASAVAAAAVIGAPPPAEAQSPNGNGSSTHESKEERLKARYQPDAPDVQAFYRTNRY
jgi:hypothetical protein